MRGHICWLGLKYVTSQRTFCGLYVVCMREDVKIPTYKPHTNHKRSSVRSHTLAPSSRCDLSLLEATDRSGSHKLSHLRLSSFVVCLWSQKGNFDVSPKKGCLTLKLVEREGVGRRVWHMLRLK